MKTEQEIRIESIEEFTSKLLYEIEKARIIDDEDVSEPVIIDIINSLRKYYRTLLIK